MRVSISRTALGSVAVALLTLALLAPAASAGNGNGQGGGQGQGHGKPADAGPSRGQGNQTKHEKKVQPEKKTKPDHKAKPEKKARPPKKVKADKVRDDDQGTLDDSGVADEPAARPTLGGVRFLAMLPCKHGGWLTLQRVDGTPFDNQGRCVSYVVRGGVLAPLAPPDDAEEPDEAPAALPTRGGANLLAMLPCKDGGWQTQQRADGTRFDNQGRCVSYAVRGGVLAAVMPMATISFVPTVDVADSCDATATLGDLDPSTTYVGTFTVDGAEVPIEPITTDALGDASVALGTFATGQVLALTVDVASSGDTTVACPLEAEAP